MDIVIVVVVVIIVIIAILLPDKVTHGPDSEVALWSVALHWFYRVVLFRLSPSQLAPLSVASRRYLYINIYHCSENFRLLHKKSVSDSETWRARKVKSEALQPIGCPRPAVPLEPS